MAGQGRMVRTAAGIGLYAEVEGPADAPVTLVFSHGWTLDSRIWDPVVRSVLAHSPATRVVRYDHRGHGSSDSVPPHRMTIAALADDLAELIDRLAPDGKLVLAGHSMGGMTIMALAERYPELFARRVAGVALVATASGGLGDTTFGLSVRALNLVRRGEARLAGSVRFNRRPKLTRWPLLLAPGLRYLIIGRGADRGALRRSMRCIADCRPSAITGFRPTLEDHRRDAALAAFEHIPTRVLAGARDKLTPVYQSRRIVEHARNASLTVLPDAGHMLPVERVDSVSSCLTELVSSARAEPGARSTRPVTRAPSGSEPGPARPAGS
ncbi:alpha/beta hydrolase [Pseudonocardia eucalypti]|uniref:Alpha/beta hydrolase n=1 Tax=Pseudonocardia eucalypti TaxID=648755 RepID=A0ABP9QB87_9PSEU|nr:pimeloyl-ACP methyl ester carboxylesterase [Pseudonocardia eucalypti]